MNTQLNTGAGRRVIQLIKCSENEFLISTPAIKNAQRISLKAAAKTLTRLGVPFEEFEAACFELQRNNHNVAEFGMLNFSFMYSHFDMKLAKRFGVLVN